MPCSISVTRKLYFLFIFMNPVDLLGAKISIRVRIGMTHPYIEKGSPLSLPQTPTVDVKACIRGLVSPSGKLFACNRL